MGTQCSLGSGTAGRVALALLDSAVIRFALVSAISRPHRRACGLEGGTFGTVDGA
jgi:hypothetical protein